MLEATTALAQAQRRLARLVDGACRELDHDAATILVGFTAHATAPDATPSTVWRLREALRMLCEASLRDQPRRPLLVSAWIGADALLAGLRLRREGGCAEAWFARVPEAAGAATHAGARWREAYYG